MEPYPTTLPPDSDDADSDLTGLADPRASDPSLLPGDLEDVFPIQFAVGGVPAFNKWPWMVSGLFDRTKPFGHRIFILHSKNLEIFKY